MKQKAFTLIELLVVIAIIGILATVVLSSLSSARERARDAKRISNINQMQKALELYYLDNGFYPHHSGGQLYYYVFSDTSKPCGYVAPKSPEGAWCDLEKLLQPYIPSLPRGEIISDREYLYRSYFGRGYGLGVELENPNSISESDGGTYDNLYEVGVVIDCLDGWQAWNATLCRD